MKTGNAGQVAFAPRNRVDSPERGSEYEAVCLSSIKSEQPRPEGALATAVVTSYQGFPPVGPTAGRPDEAERNDPRLQAIAMTS
jgi:hypothetical protein